VSKNAAPGTYASGVQMVREALPVVMSDLVKNAPQTQKEKISKLLDIWERGQTFPLEMLTSMKQLVNGKPNSKRLQSDIAFPTDSLLQMHRMYQAGRLRAMAMDKPTTIILINRPQSHQQQQQQRHHRLKIRALYMQHSQVSKMVRLTLCPQHRHHFPLVRTWFHRRPQVLFYHHLLGM
jgi:hypothetical protein